MAEIKGVGRRRTQLLDDSRNKRRHWEVKEETEDRKRWKRHKEEIQVIFLKSMDLLTSSIPNNYNSMSLV